LKWEFRDDRPIYTQLIEQIQIQIISGNYPAGSKLPSVRDLATEASVNPNTMQKALSELERSGLVYSQRTAGRFITEDQAMISQIKTKLATEKIEEFLEQMTMLGYSKQEAIALISKILKEEN
jgi:GntR family transcriptional regulator